MLRKFYVDGPFGQIHCRKWGDHEGQPPLLCLSPAPFSSRAFSTLGPKLSATPDIGRSVIAIDYPGYGNSEAIEGETSIGDLASCVLSVIRECSPTNSASLFGFHTGCLVAVETAIKEPASVERLLICDVPFFSPEKQAELLEKMPATVELDSQLSGLNKAWEFCVSSKLEHISLRRAHQMFVDYITPGETVNRVFRAAFNYPCAEKFKRIKHPTFIIATKSNLYEPSTNAAALIDQSSLVEAPHIDGSVLEKGADDIVDIISQLPTS